MVWNEKYSEFMPLIETYQYIINQLDYKKYSENQQQDAKKMREEIIGNEWAERYPDTYWDINMLIDMNIKPYEWRNPALWTKTDRAKWRAVNFIKSMLYLVEKYNDYQKDKRDKARKNAQGGNNDKKGR